MRYSTESRASQASTKKWLIAISLLIVSIAAVGFAFQIGQLEIVVSPDLGSAFDSTSALPKDEIEAVLNQARETVTTINGWGVWFKWAGTTASWTSFLVNASITLIAGFYGRNPAPQGGSIDTAGLPGRAIRLIGFLAALSAVLTAFGSLAVTTSAEYFSRADQCQGMIVESRKALKNPAMDVDQQLVIFDDLKTKVARC